MDSIDDNSLRYELESRGQTVGPIVDSTRELYRRVLKRLVDEEDKHLDQLYDSQQLLAANTSASAPTPTGGHQSVLTESKSTTKSKFLLFLCSLILCIVFAYYVKRY